MEINETVKITIPKKTLEFADYYAGMLNENRDDLIGEIVSERLADIRDKIKIYRI